MFFYRKEATTRTLIMFVAPFVLFHFKNCYLQRSLAAADVSPNLSFLLEDANGLNCKQIIMFNCKNMREKKNLIDQRPDGNLKGPFVF